ncbi:2-amino-4-hydroxy-6-hydroxymethyldihydropteridine diphosphokinase [Salinispirillum marinum]|uniref:2-amino-4-hydroxy-6-hydroxymethyldihydropteridine pyrophosphokinase n=2 Tax=Saccharospirillaceae TaxID=255527 RepID=A0ABV8BK19_9GAMM
MKQFHQAFIGLGSNMDDPIAQLDKAIDALQRTEGVSLVAVSGYYRSQPIGPQDQDDFINAVVDISTNLEPEALLSVLQTIEQAQGRIRDRHWGPRTLDLDLLYYEGETRQSEMLTLPHPRITERAFVLIPLYDLAPDLVFQDHPLEHWLTLTDDQSVEHLSL